MLEQFESLAKSRRSVRHFTDQPVSRELLTRLLEIAHWAPSGYNLQPTHFLVVTEAATKERLCHACMDQAQIREAGAVVVFAGDRRVVESNFERVLAADREAGGIDERYEGLLRKVIPLAFGHGPAGFGWLWKATLLPLVRLARPIPSMPAIHKRYWLTKQVLLTAMNFMLAARAAGLGTVPMEGFDEGRVKRVLGIPRHWIVPLVIPVGYPAEQKLTKTRLPVEERIHWESW